MRHNAHPLAVAAGVGLLGVAQFGSAAPITNTTRINVLRQYNSSNINMVTEAKIGNYAASVGGNAGNDGSAWSLQSGSNTFNNNTQTAGEQFTFPGFRTVSAIHFEYGGYPVTSTVFEGFDGTTWQTMATTTTGGTVNLTSAIPGTPISAFRYTTTAPQISPTGNYFFVNEVALYDTTGQSVDTNDGYSFLRDKLTAQVNSSSALNTSTVWTDTTGGDLANGTYNDALSAQNNSAAGGNRAFKSFALDGSYDMNYAHLGFFHGQTWKNFELYTSNAGTMPATQTLTGNDPATIQAAGWTLQFQQGNTTVGAEAKMPFSAPGASRYALLVWNVQNDSASELELFNNVPVPEPTGVSLLACGALVLLRRRRGN